MTKKHLKLIIKIRILCMSIARFIQSCQVKKAALWILGCFRPNWPKPANKLNALFSMLPSPPPMHVNFFLEWGPWETFKISKLHAVLWIVFLHIITLNILYNFILQIVSLCIKIFVNKLNTPIRHAQWRLLAWLIRPGG